MKPFLINKKMKKIIYTLIIILITGSIKAQDVEFSLGADIVSSYIWRGTYQTSSAVQPGMGLDISGFSLSAWGSVPFQGIAKEVDFSASYEIAGLSLSVTDYWWEGEGAYKYYTYSSRSTGHLFEGTISYKLPCEEFPLTLSWNTMFAGQDYKTPDSEGKRDRAYSSYISASYPFSIKAVDLELSVGITPWEGIYADDAAVIHAGIKASKTLTITDSFSLPIFAEIITNPRREDIFFVFGISL